MLYDLGHMNLLQGGIKRRLRHLMICLCVLASCGSSAGGQKRPSIPIYEFFCRHEAVLSALAIEPHCGPEPVIAVGYVEQLGQMHAEAFCEDQGWVRIVGTRVVGVYPAPAYPMVNMKTYSLSEYLFYFFGWSLN